METKMLRWTAGVTTLMDRIRNDVNRQKFDIAPISDNVREARIRWYGHALCGKEDSVRKIGLNFEGLVSLLLLCRVDAQLARGSGMFMHSVPGCVRAWSDCNCVCSAKSLHTVDWEYM
ncbi:unnamed protein product [Heligmosomoides polygyrus]|uniref:Reverse transcriptase n=1 Tax=Heligmosomoides polygyrus TaxID=6339 RepID=A0A183F9S0_HELPZ|nr:unnamed protein product [Heligmosomoides polygyrus]